MLGSPLEDQSGLETALQHYWTELMDTLAEAVTVHSADGRVVFANNQAGILCRLDADDLIGQDCDTLFHREQPDCAHSEVLLSGRTVSMELRLARQGREYQLTLIPMIEPDSRVSGFVRVLADVSERQEAEDHLLKVERLATVGQMLSGIAHDIGTPLNIVSGYCEYLLTRTREAAEGHKELSTMLQQTRRIGAYIKQMVELALPAQKRTDAIGIYGFLGESLNLMGHHLRRSGVQVTLTCRGGPPLLYGDAPRLRQAFFSLLLNASQNLPHGSTIDLAIEDSAGQPEAVRVAMGARSPDGHEEDFSSLYSSLTASSGFGLEIGLSLVRDVFEDFGVVVETSDSRKGGRSIVLNIPARLPKVSASGA